MRAEMEKMSVEQLKAVKEQADMEVNLLQDSLTTSTPSPTASKPHPPPSTTSLSALKASPCSSLSSLLSTSPAPSTVPIFLSTSALATSLKKPCLMARITVNGNPSAKI